MEAVHLDSEMTQIGPQLPVIGHWPRNVFRLNVTNPGSLTRLAFHFQPLSSNSFPCHSYSRFATHSKPSHFNPCICHSCASRQT
jgi:hypothetical protein